ncbi:MAG: 3-keto-disaccharide hydrolase [Opitutaceae bacterium]
MLKPQLFLLLMCSCSLLRADFSANEIHISEESFTGWELVMADDSIPTDQLIHIEPNLLTLFGKDHPKGIFRTKGVFTNYELSLEWRWPNTPGNGGLLLHCDPTVTKAAWPKCLEVQLMHGKAGNFRKNGESIEVEAERTTKKPFIQRLVSDIEKPPGEWNSMRVVADGDRMEVFINDKLVNKGERASASSGFIALQLELADIQFKSMILKTLDDKR